MADNNEISQDENVEESINLLDIYRNINKTKVEDITLDISDTYYSNTAYMLVGPRDVVIDFVSMPGTIRDGKRRIDGIRVYMSHVAAQSLAERLGKLIEGAYNEKIFARVEFPQPESVRAQSEKGNSIKEE